MEVCRFGPVREVRPEFWVRVHETAPVCSKNGAETDEFLVEAVQIRTG